MSNTTHSSAQVIKLLFSTETLEPRPTAWYVAAHTGEPGIDAADNEVSTSSDANYARRVYTDGSLYFNDAYTGNFGVRPAFFVESGITLSVEPDQVELSTSALLAEFTSKQLVEEVLRRIAEGQEDGDDNEEDDF